MLKARIVRFALFLFFFSPFSYAQAPFERHAGHKIFYSVLNSSFIPAETASLHGLTRGKDIGLVNISLIKESPDGDSLGLAGIVDGRVTNLLMQSQPLEFLEIREGNVVYYIAEFDFDNEEAMHFDIEVEIEAAGAQSPFSFRFTKIMYEN